MSAQSAFSESRLRMLGQRTLDKLKSSTDWLSEISLALLQFAVVTKSPTFSPSLSKKIAMAELYKLIPEISLGEMNWTAKVIVVEKSNTKTAIHSPTKYMNMTLIDPQGNQVQATIYEANILPFQDTMEVSKTYLISNATVKHTKLQYRKVAGDVQWTINGKTKVEELKENHNALLFSRYKFISFHKLQTYMDLESEISTIFINFCILAIEIDMGLERQVQTPSGTTSIVQDVPDSYTYYVG
ncbi:replication protein A 70 kDa DNA-binding subunit C-like [Cannabis sativa]|uniref:replication protein A 70 kDa DNA-binding subunit C-like n=1 Tax=Cannabis sativa TaxID=3483 RepID=UPI0029CA0E7B|nr:replication protein A 70 kDa DNA-binding subunit C-like [Cannabis sativa]